MNAGEATQILTERIIQTYQTDILNAIRQVPIDDSTWRTLYGENNEGGDDWRFDEYPDGRFVHPFIKEKK